MIDLLCYVMLCYVMLCYVMLCYVMLCYVMLCYVMLCYVMLCSNPLKLCEQKVARKIRSILIKFWSSKQHSRFQAPSIQNNDS